MTVGFFVRTATTEEANTVFKASCAFEKWNPGSKDAEYFQKTYPEYFFVGELDGEVVSCVSVVPYREYAFLGMYIVQPGYRGKGYGKKTFQAAMESVKGLNVSLDAVLQEIKTYEKSGFVFQSFLLNKYNGKFDVDNHYRPNNSIVPLNKISNEQIAEYEQSINSFYRPEIWEHWKRYERGHSFAYVENSKLVGIASIRPGVTAYKVGPLYADSAEIAKVLFINLVNAIPKDSSIELDTPATNSDAQKLVKEFLKFSPVFDCMKMWTQEPPKHHINKIYGTLALEFG
jgi:GNAT superfamily N-acetyltransferase